MSRREMTLLVLVNLIGLLGNAALAQGNDEDAQRKKLLDGYHAMEGEIVFYGKVMDQHGNPIEDAGVEVSVPTVKTWGPMSYAKKTLLTDKKGVFEVSSKTYGVSKLVGQYLYVERITKDGHEGDWVRRTNRTFSFSTDNAKRFVPDASKPVVYRLRKKGESTFLCEEMYIDLETKVNDSGNPLGYDFIRRHRIKDTRNLFYDWEPVFPDLQVKATFNTNDTTWTAVLSPGNTNGGIIVSDQLLYEAPDTGYQPDYTFTSGDGKPVKDKYVYLKSRDPAIYTRYEIEYVVATKEFFRLSGKSVTNPYGDRNLELATDLPYEVTKQLTEDAKASFRQNKRPSKPDLPKLIKDAKDKADKDKSKQ